MHKPFFLGNSFKRMVIMLKRFSDMKKFIKKSGLKKKLILLLPKLESVFEASYLAYQENYVDLIIIGNIDIIPDKIKQIDNLEIFDTKDDEAAVLKAISLVDKYKSSAILFNDDLNIHKLLKKVLEYKKTFLSFIHLADFENLSKLVAFTDTMIHFYPSLKEKRKIIQNCVSLMRKLGVKKPQVSILSATKQIVDKIPSSTDAALLSGMVNTGQLKNCIVNGPLLINESIFDFASDILLFPNIDSAVFAVDLLSQFSIVKKISICYGFICPILVSSDKDSVLDSLSKIEFTLLL